MKDVEAINNMGLEDVTWATRLINWADENNIPQLQWHDDECIPEIEGFWLGFPRDVEKIINLTHLDLSWHDLTELPEELGNLSNLVELHVDKSPDGLQPDWRPKTDNQLSFIPEWIRGLKKLRKLSLEGNAIREIPDWIDQLTQLETLWLAKNQISQIPLSVYGLKNLKTLSLSSNLLRLIPEGLKNLEQLESLSLWGNQLPNFPLEILELKQLNSLELSGNHFLHIEPEVFELEALEDFDMAEVLFNLAEIKTLH